VREKELIDWVEDFMRRNGLFADYGVVGLSGGADSILLSHVLEALARKGLFKGIRHIHIDHGLRPESSKQAYELEQYAAQRGWNFELIKLTGPVATSNIESWARAQRKSIFNDMLQNQEVLYLGHHIDDSFEWFIRQTVGSSSSGHSHGIPLINGNIRRPFHCLTKKQIERFVELLNLPVLIDKSNESLAFQRNAISQLVKEPMLKLFPKGLAHFVEHANSWAKKEGLAPPVLNQAEEAKDSVSDVLWQNYLGKGAYSLVKLSGDSERLNDWANNKEEIVSLITLLSNKQRGELRQNLEKLFRAALTNGARGPLDFSGGVKVLIYPGMLVFLNKDGDQTIKERIGILEKASEIPFDDLTIGKATKTIENLGGIGLVAFQDKNLFGVEGMKSDPIFDVLISSLKSRGIFVRPFSQLYQRAAKKGLLEKSFKGLALH
jgi:tRNA(Ile)-lysidine synthetase-like protein